MFSWCRCLCEWARIFYVSVALFFRCLNFVFFFVRSSCLLTEDLFVFFRPFCSRTFRSRQHFECIEFLTGGGTGGYNFSCKYISFYVRFYSLVRFRDILNQTNCFGVASNQIACGSELFCVCCYWSTWIMKQSILIWNWNKKNKENTSHFHFNIKHDPDKVHVSYRPRYTIASFPN